MREIKALQVQKGVKHSRRKKVSKKELLAYNNFLLSLVAQLAERAAVNC